MIGEESGETHRLGDKVSVRLVEAAPVAGALRFELLSEGRYEGRQRGGRDTGTRRVEGRSRAARRRRG